MNIRVFGIGVVAMGTALAACGGGSTVDPAPTQSPSVCPLVAPNLIIAPPQLLYPIPNATGVPDGNFPLVVAYNNSTPPPMQIVPVNGGDAIAGGAWGGSPSPMPSPAATPSSSLETIYSAAIPVLAPHTAYNARVTEGTPPCQYTEISGTFTTK